MAVKGHGSSFKDPDAPPDMWAKLVWSLLQVKDLQVMFGETAMDIGADEWLSRGWNDGNLRIPSLLKHIDTYARNLRERAHDQPRASSSKRQTRKTGRP